MAGSWSKAKARLRARADAARSGQGFVLPDLTDLNGDGVIDKQDVEILYDQVAAQLGQAPQ